MNIFLIRYHSHRKNVNMYACTCNYKLFELNHGGRDPV